MKDKERILLPAIGGSSLLVIFAVLCLTIFALLGLGTVQAGGRLSDASMEAVQAYYAADCEAEARLAALRAAHSTGLWSYQVPVTETQALAVTVSIQGDSYEILQWQLTPTIQWENDDSITVWDGDPVF